MLSLISVGLAGLLAAVDPAASVPAPTSSVPPAHYLLLNAPDRRVRTTDARLQALVAEGLHRSSTFASLVAAVNRTDVIVYVESVLLLPKNTMGRLAMVPRAGEFRYLRIQVRADLSRRDTIALIGHELQHALEIGGASDVRDTPSLIRLYQRIGHVSGGEHTFDTNEAQDTGRVVRRELAG